MGWLAQWQEMMGDADRKIAGPRQIYKPSLECLLDGGSRDNRRVVQLPHADRVSFDQLSAIVRQEGVANAIYVFG